jgi:hypothetical protein
VKEYSQVKGVKMAALQKNIQSRRVKIQLQLLTIVSLSMIKHMKVPTGLSG